MKKIGIMQPYLFPYLGYFQHINAVDKFVLLDDVNFIKRGYINRNQILLNGSAHRFTLPLIKPSQNKLILDTEVSGDEKALLKLVQTIASAYKKAPQFDLVFPLIKSIVLFENKDLSKYLANSICVLCDYIGINTQIIKSSKSYEKGDLAGQNRILDIVLKEDGVQYINPIGGVDIYDRDLFSKSNVALSFHKMDAIIYEQFKNEFVPHLSIIDVLMFNSIDEVKELLKKYTLV